MHLAKQVWQPKEEHRRLNQTPENQTSCYNHVDVPRHHLSHFSIPATSSQYHCYHPLVLLGHTYPNNNNNNKSNNKNKNYKPTKAISSSSRGNNIQSDRCKINVKSLKKYNIKTIQIKVDYSIAFKIRYKLKYYKYID